MSVRWWTIRFDPLNYPEEKYAYSVYKKGNFKTSVCVCSLFNREQKQHLRDWEKQNPDVRVIIHNYEYEDDEIHKPCVDADVFFKEAFDETIEKRLEELIFYLRLLI